MAYWSSNELGTNAVVFLNVLGALLLGLLVGYQRFYHGRAAGMRTYGLVCMTSSALTVAAGYPDFWFGGTASAPAADPTRVIQGIVTGVGFLGAGIIMRVGLNISGLTTAASIWAASGIGVLVGLAFYFAAILVSVLSATCPTSLGCSRWRSGAATKSPRARSPSATRTASPSGASSPSPWAATAAPRSPS